jgi:hypothetical protein
MACRGAQTAARVSARAFDGWAGLVLDSSGVEAIGGYGKYCYSASTRQGWSARDPNESSSWSQHAFDDASDGPVQVVGFTHTDTEATSVVLLGSRYTLTQHWHPSSVDARVYQVDVTIAAVDPDQEIENLSPLLYRQVVPLNLSVTHYGYSMDLVEGVGDGVNDATTNIYGNGDADSGPDTIDNPAVSLATNDCEAGDCRGAAFDMSISPQSTTTPDGPQFSVFYGFADGAGEAGSLLSSAGATTRAVATTVDIDYNNPDPEPTFINRAILVGVRHNP